MRIISGFKDIRVDGEDFVLTPYLFFVCVNSVQKVFGIGICLFWYSLYIGVGFNIPKGFPYFYVSKFNKQSKQ